MSAAAAPSGCAANGAPLHPYRRRRPERTVLYRLVQQHLETWLARTRENDPEGFPVTASIERELRGYLTCGILAHGFVRARCAGCGHDFLVAFAGEYISFRATFFADETSTQSGPRVS